MLPPALILPIDSRALILDHQSSCEHIRVTRPGQSRESGGTHMARREFAYTMKEASMSGVSVSEERSTHDC